MVKPPNLSLDKLDGSLAKVLVAIGLGIVGILAEVILNSSLQINQSFLIFLIPLSFSSYWGGIRSGTTTLLVAFLVSSYFILFPNNPSIIYYQTNWINLGLLTFVGLTVSFLIDKSKFNKEFREFKQNQKELTATILRQQQDLQKAQEEIKSRDEFLSIASHELKTPLTSMLLQIQTVLHSVRNVSLANFSVQNLLSMLESAEQQTVRLSKMINDLLNVSLITTGRMDLEREEVDLTQTVADVVGRFKDKMKKDGIEYKLDTEKTVVGYWDKLRIEQVVTNLISNALKYGNGKPINIKVLNSGGSGKIIIEDHGIGIPKDKQEKIFAKFERAVTSSEIKGLGVGLYITNQIVKAHHGLIKVSSQPNLGSTFTIELPLK